MRAFIHIIDSMLNQHAKWLKVTRKIGWRCPIASLNYLLTSHVWQHNHNGFGHQDPGFIDHVVNKKAEVVRIYLPPDANTLLSVADHCLRSRNYVNVIVAGKAPAAAVARHRGRRACVAVPARPVGGPVGLSQRRYAGNRELARGTTLTASRPSGRVRMRIT
ncbi:phosphoketolase [Variovorax boronicumulans]